MSRNLLVGCLFCKLLIISGCSNIELEIDIKKLNQQILEKDNKMEEYK